MREDLAGLCLEERMMSEGSGVNDADVTTPENEAEDKEQEARGQMDRDAGAEATQLVFS